MEKPKETKCKECGIKIYGFTEKDLNWKLKMHSLVHQKKAVAKQ